MTLRVRWLGRLPYDEAWDLQKALWEGRLSGRTVDDYLLLLEHPHTYTVGRNGDGSNLLLPEGELERVGAVLRRVDRGGDITYHGPGQLVGYPIRRLPAAFDDGRPDVVAHVRVLEEALIAALADLGVDAWAEPGFTGVWTSHGKIAAIGVRVSRGITTHGFALNVDPDLAYFDDIVPCGIAGRAVTSITEVLGRRVSLEETVRFVLPHLGRLLGDGDPEVQLGAFARGAGTADTRYDVDRRVADGVFSPRARDEVPIAIRGRLAGEPERPEWMRVRADLATEGYRDLKHLMRDLGLNTVCEEAKCPNIYECWGQGTATLMLLGDRCTRACSFCDVTTGRPGPVDEDEPYRAAEAIAKLELHHAVLTSVNRDDLPDGGAGIFATTIREIRERSPRCAVEVLIPDFKGDRAALQTVMDAAPAVLNHNTETVLRLQRDIRTAASYGRSLTLLARAKWMVPEGTVKSGLIVGMGETEAEILGALADLRAVGVDIVTIGQYLRPTPRHRPIDRYVDPEEFARYRREGDRLGLAHVEAGPLVRSSYHARDSLAAAQA
jgi:lipoyl synthase